MRVGILGDRERATAWEKHLRPLTAVHEVVIAGNLDGLGHVDACLLIDESADNLAQMAELIKLGIHSYLISSLPTDHNQLKLIYHHSQESDVRIQFSHWPTISPSSQYMRQQIPKPSFLQVIKENSYISFTENKTKFSSQWQDEIAWITRWMDMEIHRMDAHSLMTDQPEAGIQIHMKFENGSAAAVTILNAGSENRHRRIASGSGIMLDCHVERQSVRKINLSGNDQSDHSVDRKTLDASQTAPLSASLFFKAIKLRRDTGFSAYDALRASRAIEKVKGQIK